MLTSCIQSMYILDIKTCLFYKLEIHFLIYIIIYLLFII